MTTTSPPPPPPGADCPCGTTRGALSLGTATSRYTPAPDVCLQPCVYDPIATGGCPAGTTCDPFGTCQVACAEDAVCQLRAVDPDGDGRIAWVVDPTTLGACDAVTGRCARPGRPGAAIGDACSDDHDCAADAFCASGAMLGLGSCVGIGCAGCTSTCVSFERGALCITCDQALAFGLPCSDAGVPDDAGIDGAGIADAGADDVGTDGG